MELTEAQEKAERREEEVFRMMGICLAGALAGGRSGQKAIDVAWKAAELAISSAEQRHLNNRATAKAEEEKGEREAEERRVARARAEKQADDELDAAREREMDAARKRKEDAANKAAGSTTQPPALNTPPAVPSGGAPVT